MVNTQKILEFLTELEKNNNREWYHAHKKERQEACLEFEKFIQELIFEIGKFDESILLLEPKDLTFKMVRDTRFSADKSPYNPVMRAHIGPKGKQPIPVGYFLSIQPHDATMLGGGLFADMFKDATTMIRDYIVEHGEEFDKIVTAQSFTSHFQLLGSQLKKVPRGYDVNHPYGQYLKYKSWFVEEYISDEIVLDSQKFVEFAAKEFQHMKAFHDYLNKALIHFEMPQRP